MNITIPAGPNVSRQVIRRGLFVARLHEVRAYDYVGGDRPTKRTLRDMARQWAHRKWKDVSVERKRRREQ